MPSESSPGGQLPNSLNYQCSRAAATFPLPRSLLRATLCDLEVKRQKADASSPGEAILPQLMEQVTPLPATE